MVEVKKVEKSLDEKIDEIKKKIIGLFKSLEVFKDYNIYFEDVILNIEKNTIKVHIGIKERAYGNNLEVNDYLMYRILQTIYFILKYNSVDLNRSINRNLNDALIERLKEEKSEKHFIKIVFPFDDITSSFYFVILHPEFGLESPFLFECRRFYISMFNRYREFFGLYISLEKHEWIGLINSMKKDEIEELREFLKYCYNYIMIKKI